jgi:PAS domain S-box-containing protein
MIMLDPRREIPKRCNRTRLAAMALLLLPVIAPAEIPPSERVLITVTGDREYPPYCFLDNGLPSGFDIDLIREVARAVNLELVIELKPWSEARRMLETGRARVIPGMARIPAREQLFDFTTPTKQMGFDLFVPKESPIHSLHDARTGRILVQQAGVMYDLIRQQGWIEQVIPVPDAPEAIRLLAEGGYDGAIVNRVQGYHVIDREKIRSLRSLGAQLPTIPYAFAVQKGESELLDRLNEGLNIVKATGLYEQIYDRWFGVYEANHATRTLRRVAIIAAAVFAVAILLALLNMSLKRKVRERTAELRQIIDLIPHFIFARDESGRYVLANETTAQSMGLQVNDILGKRQCDLFPGDTHNDLYLREDQEVFHSRQSVFIPETRYRDRHGVERVIQVSKLPFRQHDGIPHAVLCVGVDITELKRAEAALRAGRERLHAILNAIADGVIATDADRRIVAMNPEAERLAGAPANSVHGRMLGEILRLQDPDGNPVPWESLALDVAVRAHGEKAPRHVVLLGDDHAPRDVAIQTTPVAVAPGEPAGLVVVIRDMTEENRLNARIGEMQKMESIGRLAGGVAHDFNNLLTGVIGYAELLSISLADHHECKGYLKGIFEASERARDLVQQLLTFSRRQPREIQPVNVHTVIGHVLSLLQHTLDRRITLSRHLHAQVFTVSGDRSQIQNALLNIALNARDAMPNGGSLSVTTGNTIVSPADAARHPYPVRPGQHLLITLTDTGIGMDRDTVQHIFEPFFTTKGRTGGTGLGLASVYGTVKEHGGFIEVSSQPGRGATFTLGLPVDTDAVMTEESPAEGVALRGSGCVLIVDDEPLVLRTGADILRSLGYRVLTAINGRDALTVFTRHQEEVDLVLLDMIMPELNGEETFREMRKIRPDVRVLLCSGYLQEYTLPELLAMGIIGLLQKPYRKIELAARIADALRPPG